jgi:hypothetical protein
MASVTLQPLYSPEKEAATAAAYQAEWTPGTA